jgi:hypothetical protein
VWRLKRGIQRDTGAVDELMGVFVFVAVFVVISALLIALMQNTLAAGRDIGDFEVHEGSQVIQGTEYGFLDPESGFNITEDYATNDWTHDADESMYFDDAVLTDDTVEVQVVIDHNLPLVGMPFQDEELYRDFIFLYVEYGWFSHDETAISYQQIITSQLSDSNQSLVTVWLHNTNYTLIITAPGPPEFFNVFVGLSQYNIQLAIPLDMSMESLKSAGMWTILGQLMTASLPNITPIVNYLISVPFWVSVGFLAVMVIRAFIPFLGG